jgi:hypothetical protein
MQFKGIHSISKIFNTLIHPKKDKKPLGRSNGYNVVILDKIYGKEEEEGRG